jgi:hypothetical protein
VTGTYGQTRFAALACKRFVRNCSFTALAGDEERLISDN